MQKKIESAGIHSTREDLDSIGHAKQVKILRKDILIQIARKSITIED